MSYIISKEGLHCTLYAEISRDGVVVWRVERSKATELTRARVRSVLQHCKNAQEVTIRPARGQ
jgi:hypothetical protein